MKTYKYYVNSNGRRIKLLVLRPTKHARASALTAGVLWIHGGGFATGMSEMVYITRAKALVEKFGVTVCAPAYTLSWKRPYPAAIEDCYSALLWFKEHSWELGFNPELLIAGGESAGGGLCAALCMLARDRGEVDIKSDARRPRHALQPRQPCTRLEHQPQPRCVEALPARAVRYGQGPKVRSACKGK